MLVLQISPIRMGSTWQFNTARELLTIGKIPLVSSFLDTEIGWDVFREKQDKHIVLKSHFFELEKVISLSEGLDVRFLVSCRNLFDTLESVSRVLPAQSMDETLRGIRNSLSVIKKIHDSKLPYHVTYIDSLNSFDELVVETDHISRFLELGIPSNLISEIASRLTKDSVLDFIGNQLELEGDFNNLDDATHWHANHVSSSSMSRAVKQGLSFLQDPNVGSDVRPLEFPLSKLWFQAENFLNLLVPVTQQREELTQQRDELTQQRDELLNSTIWRTTKFLRVIVSTFRRLSLK